MKWIPFDKPWIVNNYLTGRMSNLCPDDNETGDEVIVTRTTNPWFPPGHGSAIRGRFAKPVTTKRLWRLNGIFTGDVALYQQDWSNSSFEVFGCLMDKEWSISVSGRHFIDLTLHSPHIEIKKEKLLVVTRNHDQFTKDYKDCLVISGVEWTFVKKGVATFLEAE